MKRGKSIDHCVESCSLHNNCLFSSGQCFTLTSSYELQCQEAVAVINMMVISKWFYVQSILFSTGMRSYCKRWSLCRHTTRDCTRTRARTQANTQTHAHKERENARLRKEWTGYNWLRSSVCCCYFLFLFFASLQILHFTSLNFKSLQIHQREDIYSPFQIYIWRTLQGIWSSQRFHSI